MKIISMSVYGTKPMYWHGIRENVLLVPVIYPGWRLRIYCSDEAPDGFWESLGRPYERVRMGKSLGHSGMFWRFLPAFEPGIKYTIFRDADSRLNVREAAAVNAWITSGRNAHCMHDHEHHRCLPLFGGMWGIRGGVLSASIRRRLQREIQQPQRRGDDMTFLTRYVFPRIQRSILRHTSRPVRWHDAKPFPTHELYRGFVGQQFDHFNNPISV